MNTINRSPDRLRMKRFVFGIILLAMLLLPGCSSSTLESADMVSSNYSGGGLRSVGVEEAYSFSSEYDGQTPTEIVKSTMMLARDASLSVDVKDIETFDYDLKQKVDEYGGYFEDSTINDYGNAYSTDRYAYYSIKLPQERLDEFLGVLDDSSSVTSRSITAEDLSLEYVDVKAHIGALEQEKENLQRLMDKAESVSEIIEIEGRLSEVQYSLDSVNEQKKFIENRVSYSSVNISAHEERNVEHPIAMAFEINIKEEIVNSIDSAVSAFIGIVMSIPVVIIVTAFLILFIWVLKKVCGKVFKKKNGGRYVIVPVGFLEQDKHNEKDAPQ